MADPAPISCNNPEHASLISIVGEQTRLISQLFANIQALEGKLEVAQEAARSPAVSHNPTAQTPNFAKSGDSYADQQGYSPAPSAYGAKRAQAQGQLCNYGSGCTRDQCWYEHPGRNSTGTVRPSTSTPSQSQPVGNTTGRTKQECRYGTKCVRTECSFEHPSDWVPPNSMAWQPQPQPQPQQESNTEAPAAESDNWGTNQDLSSWGAAPTSDWGTPVDNTWGAPASANNGWEKPAENSWNAHARDQRKSHVNNTKSPSASMSREGSVSNVSTNGSRGRGRKTRGKGRRADSESITTESTPMSPTTLEPTPMSAYVDPIPSQTPLSPLAQSTDQTYSFNDPSALDESNTPPLEQWGPSSSSEPEAPGTPKASWSDEPNIDVVYFPEPPSNLNESQPSVPEDKSMDLPEDQLTTKPAGGSVDLDESAPSDLYSSWGVTGPSASDWGLDPTAFPEPAPTVDNNMSGRKSKGKGKQKENLKAGTNGRSTPMGNSSNSTARSETKSPSVNESGEPEPAPTPAPPEPPQGVPHDQIPDWLLGADEDAHAALGIPRAVSPKPDASLAPPRLAPTNPPLRPPLSKLAGENFPTLSGILPTPKPSQPKDETPSKPTFSPRPVGWKITRTSDTSSSGSGKGGKSKDGWSKN